MTKTFSSFMKEAIVPENPDTHKVFPDILTEMDAGSIRDFNLWLEALSAKCHIKFPSDLIESRLNLYGFTAYLDEEYIIEDDETDGQEVYVIYKEYGDPVQQIDHTETVHNAVIVVDWRKEGGEYYVDARVETVTATEFSDILAGLDAPDEDGTDPEDLIDDESMVVNEGLTTDELKKKVFDKGYYDGSDGLSTDQKYMDKLPASLRPEYKKGHAAGRKDIKEETNLEESHYIGDKVQHKETGRKGKIVALKTGYTASGKTHEVRWADGSRSVSSHKKSELKKIKEEVVEEGLKLIATHSNGNDHAKVYRNSEYNEYQVKYHKNGKHLKNADSFHDDKEDAHATAKHQVANLKEEVIEEGKSTPVYENGKLVGHKGKVNNGKGELVDVFVPVNSDIPDTKEITPHGGKTNLPATKDKGKLWKSFKSNVLAK